MLHTYIIWSRDYEEAGIAALLQHEVLYTQEYFDDLRNQFKKTRTVKLSKDGKLKYADGSEEDFVELLITKYAFKKLDYNQWAFSPIDNVGELKNLQKEYDEILKKEAATTHTLALNKLQEKYSSRINTSVEEGTPVILPEKKINGIKLPTH